MDHLAGRLAQHLEHWLGQWPATRDGVDVVTSPQRSAPGWDGQVHDVIGVATPERAVLSVPPHLVEMVGRVVHGHDVASAMARLREHEAQIGEALGRRGRFGQGVFRWSQAPTGTADLGEWVPTDDPRVPEWLRPFNGDVLIAWDDEGRYAAGVGRKQHDRFGHEISVGTDEAQRGRGLGRLLVATAARRIIADGAIPTYLHDPSNYASAKVADSSGFPDVGWRIVSLWGAAPARADRTA